jgi:hypothetical protein
MPDVSWRRPIDRRRFLTLLGGSTLAISVPNLNLWAEGSITSPGPISGPGRGTLLDREEPFFAEFAKWFTIADEHKYLVASQKGSMPIPVMKQFKEGLDEIARNPFPVYLEPPEITRAKIAKGYGARVDEIAIARNTTDAISQILSGIDWHQGDEILCSIQELILTHKATAQRMSCKTSSPVITWTPPISQGVSCVTSGTNTT